MALQITNTVITKDGQVIDNQITYAVHYSLTNNAVTSIQCAISAETEGVFNQIGFLRKENGRLSMDFIENADPLDYLIVFSGIAKEIEAETQILTPKSK